MDDELERSFYVKQAEVEGLAVRYALGGLSNQIFVSRYQLYLPDRQLLEDKLQELLSQ